MKISRKEMLRYMGYRGQALSPSDEAALDEAADICLAAVSPKNVVKEFVLNNKTMHLENTDVYFRGKDIAAHLDGCRRVYLIAATLGLEIDRLTARLTRERPSLGIMVDSAAVCAAESYMDDICAGLAAECGEPLTPRFSCGYGDFPLEQQRDFVRLLDTGRRIGVYLGKGLLMTPMKSVTAVVGIGGAGAAENGCGGSCGRCSAAECAYRKSVSENNGNEL